MAKEGDKAERREKAAARKAAAKMEESREELEYISLASIEVSPEPYID